MDDHKTIYLNHAGTSWPKPPPVVEAAASALALDPTDWPALFHDSHQTIANFFHVNPSRVLLTPSCTAALGLAVMDHPWQPGDRAVTSSYEHHALQRPLVKLTEHGIDVVTLPSNQSNLLDLDALEAELKSGQVRLLALTAACNVTGELLPFSAAIALAHEYGAVVLLDGAQIAGWWDLDLVELNADLFTFAGHKGPQAPWGIGGLYVAPHVSMNSPYAACDVSATSTPCATMPGYCDAGSVNLIALAGMAAACDWLDQAERKDRLRRARNLAWELTESLRGLPGLTIHGDRAFEHKMPTVAISIEERSSADLAHQLRACGLITSGGFQCAPQAHYSLGTAEHGIVRFSFGPTNQADDVSNAVRRMEMITKRIGLADTIL